MWKKIRTAAILIAIIGVLAYLIPIPCRVNTRLSGVLWTDGDASYSETAEVTVRGTYWRYLFKDNIFHGTLTFTGLDSENYTLVNLQISKKLDHTGSLPYYSASQNEIVWLGRIKVVGAFKKVILSLKKRDADGNWLDGYSDDYISAPASDRQSAVDLATETLGENFIYFKHW